MRYSDLYDGVVGARTLMEGSLDRVVATFGDRLIIRYQADPSVRDRQLSAQNIVERLAAADPTPNHEYTFWLAKLYLAGWRSPEAEQSYFERDQTPPPLLGIRRFEDVAARAAPALKVFDDAKRNKRLPSEQRDINRLKSFAQLEDIAAQYGKQPSNRQVKANQGKQLIDSGQAEVLHNDSDLLIVVPKTEAASCYFGRNTKWCTAALNDNQFDQYAVEGPLYIVLFKRSNERYQLFFGHHEQFMDAEDWEIDPDYLKKRYPDQFGKLLAVLTPIANAAGSISFNANPSEQAYLQAASRNPPSLQRAAQIPAKIQLLIAERNPRAIGYIRNIQPETIDYVIDHSSISIPTLSQLNDRQISAIISKGHFGKLPYKYKTSKFALNCFVQRGPGMLRRLYSEFASKVPHDVVETSVRVYPQSICDTPIADPELIALAIRLDPTVKTKLSKWQRNQLPTDFDIAINQYRRYK